MDNNLTFLNACRNGQKSIVRIFLDKEVSISISVMARGILLFITPVGRGTAMWWLCCSIGEPMSL